MPTKALPCQSKSLTISSRFLEGRHGRVIMFYFFFFQIKKKRRHIRILNILKPFLLSFMSTVLLLSASGKKRLREIQWRKTIIYLNYHYTFPYLITHSFNTKYLTVSEANINARPSSWDFVFQCEESKPAKTETKTVSFYPRSSVFRCICHQTIDIAIFTLFSFSTPLQPQRFKRLLIHYAVWVLWF